MKVKSLSRVQLFATPWTVAYQAPPSMEFSRQECWSGLPFPSPGDLPDPGIEPRSPACGQTLYRLSHQGSLCGCVLSRIQLFATPWAVAHQAPLSMGFPKQEYWGGLPCPPSGDLPDPWIKPASLLSSALAGGFFTTSATWEAP